MPPKKWDDEDDSTPPSSPPQAPKIARRGKFDDEEDDSDVADDWDAEDSEEEREKAKKAAAAKAKADEEARKNHKTKSQRIEEHRMANMRRKQAEDEESSSEEEDEQTRRDRLRRTEQAADLRHAEDLFDDAGGPKDRSAASAKAFVAVDATGKASTVDLASLPLLKPVTKEQFAQLRATLGPLLAANARKPQYTLFLPEFVKDLARELPSEQVKKLGSALTALANERLREEKAAEKTGKKGKAKAKATLVASRDVSSRADTTAYDDNLEDDDFM